MANTNKPDGFTPAYHMYGGVIRPAKMRIASATNASIFSGDVVNLSSGYVIQGTATGTPVGVFYGVYFTATDGTPTFSKVWTADTATQGGADAEALVYNDPGIVYEAQFTAGTPAVSFIGSKYTLSTTAGSTLNGRSKEGCDCNNIKWCSVMCRIRFATKQRNRCLCERIIHIPY